MIYHFKDDLKTLTYKLGTPLKYSNEFTFIPFKVNSNEFIIQTPKVFVPFGIQENDKSKDYIMISFQNKDNDLFALCFNAKEVIAIIASPAPILSTTLEAKAGQ